MELKYKKNITTLFLNNVNIDENTNILNNLPNGIEYLYIGHLVLDYINKINNLPPSLKHIYINFIYFEGYINEKYTVWGTKDFKNNNNHFKNIFKLPYDCDISIITNFSLFQTIEADKNKIQYLFLNWNEDYEIIKIINKRITIKTNEKSKINYLSIKRFITITEA
jgi:hypothetical protein